jgi:hypothetical protein
MKVVTQLLSPAFERAGGGPFEVVVMRMNVKQFHDDFWKIICGPVGSCGC